MLSRDYGRPGFFSNNRKCIALPFVAVHYLTTYSERPKRYLDRAVTWMRWLLLASSQTSLRSSTATPGATSLPERGGHQKCGDKPSVHTSSTLPKYLA